jgi:hypothetical protein
MPPCDKCIEKVSSLDSPKRGIFSSIPSASAVVAKVEYMMGGGVEGWHGPPDATRTNVRNYNHSFPGMTRDGTEENSLASNCEAWGFSIIED